MNNKNTLLFTLEYPPFKGGVANYYGNVVKYFDDNIKVLTGKKLTRPHWIFSLWYLWRGIKKYKINTVLVGHILPLGTVTWLLHKIIRFNYVVFLHGMDLAFALKVPRKKKMAYRILQNAKTVICANSYVAQLASEIVDDNKIVIVNPGINEQVTSNKLQVTSLTEKYNLQNKKVLLQAGRLVERKGYDKVIEALPNILHEVPELVYVLLGTGQCPVRTGSNVIFINDADDQELDAWYELCDIFIMPSRDMGGDFEGFGIVYLEANLHGKPVIAGDSGGVRDAVEDGVNGLLVDPENIDEISKAIVKLCQDEDLAEKLGKRGKERAIEKFNWEKQIAKIKF